MNNDLLTLEQLRDEVKCISDILQYGCSNGDCQIVSKRNIQHTNGSCKCSPKELSKDFLRIAIELERYGFKRFDFNKKQGVVKNG